MFCLCFCMYTKQETYNKSKKTSSLNAIEWHHVCSLKLLYCWNGIFTAQYITTSWRCMLYTTGFVSHIWVVSERIFCPFNTLTLLVFCYRTFSRIFFLNVIVITENFRIMQNRNGCLCYLLALSSSVEISRRICGNHLGDSRAVLRRSLPWHFSDHDRWMNNPSLT